MKPEITFPNIITATRIILTPIFVWLMVSQDATLVQISAAVFLVAAITDWYDGWYARKYNAGSAFGRFFDPLADKVLVGAALFAFVFLDLLNIWMVIIIVGRDVLVTLLRVAADRRHQPVVTSQLAKWKTAMQLVFLWYIVAVYTMQNVGWIKAQVTPPVLATFFSPWIINGSMILLTLLSLITAAQYLLENRHILRVCWNGGIARTSS
jgi:CDP-diacylglycerol--glycerol-3-phosphate 3-phosphatidyltransferase